MTQGQCSCESGHIPLFCVLRENKKTPDSDKCGFFILQKFSRDLEIGAEFIEPVLNLHNVHTEDCANITNPYCRIDGQTRLVTHL
jgi:hypothetical protein